MNTEAPNLLQYVWQQVEYAIGRDVYLPSPDDAEIIAATLYVVSLIAFTAWLYLWYRAG